jgi:hypothetical protein
VIVRDAKEIARQWVSEAGSGLPGFVGAFFHGSVNWLPDNAPLPATSDVDIMVVLEDPEPPRKPGKFRYRNVLLEVSYLPSDQVRTAEQVLGLSHLAGSFHTASVILDPSGHLLRLQANVARDYAKRRWVLRRCEHVREKMLTGFRLDEGAPFPAQVTAWLFPTSLTTHLLLVAGLRNPTVRTRYLAARELLADYGRLDVYGTLLELLGCARMTQARAEEHLDALAAAFDAAKGVMSSPFFFAADISDAGRPVAIDGSRELIARGDHREAIFWITATYSRCQLVFHHDAPAIHERFDRGYRELLGDLGIASFADLPRRRDEVIQSWPQVWAAAEEIVARNPEKVTSSLGDCDK